MITFKSTSCLSHYLFIYLHKKPNITTITQIFESADKTII